MPIYQTTSYVFKSTEHAANLFALKEFGNIYTRIMNPTTDVFERRIAAIEGGSGALAVSSGQAAQTFAILNITRMGDEIVSANNLYGGTYEQFHYSFPKLGRTVKFVDSTDPQAFKNAITSKTRAIYAETIGNPKLDVPDFEAIAEIAHERRRPLRRRQHYRGRDRQTFGPRGRHTCLICDQVHRRPWYLDRWGHSGRRQVRLRQRQVPEFTDPDPSYHGLKFWDVFGNFPGLGNVAFIIKARVQLLRDLGSCLSPFNAFLFLQGLETLPLRQQRHSENALKVAQFLKTHPAVSLGQLPGPSRPPEPQARGKVPEGPIRRDRGLWDKRRCPGREEVHRLGEALLPSREHRRLEEPRDPSRDDDPPAADCRGAGGDGCDRRLCPALRRDRRLRGHEGRPRPSAASRGIDPRPPGLLQPPDRRRVSGIPGDSVGAVETKLLTFASPPDEMQLESGERLGP